MKLLILLVVSITYVFAYDLNIEWSKFKITYNKKYKNSAVEKQRKAIFEINLKFIEKHNRKYETEKRKSNHKITYKLGITHFADLSYDEFKEKYTSERAAIRDETKCQESTVAKTKTRTASSKKRTKKRTPRSPANDDKISLHSSLTWKGDIPTEIDWRNEIKMSPILDQDDCGCCWAIAATAAAETHFSIKSKMKNRKELTKLSVQELIDCLKTPQSSGCDGGLHYEAFDYMMDKGLTPEIYYKNKDPFTDGQCKRTLMRDKRKIFAYRYMNLLQPNEEELARVVAFVGPVATSMHTPQSLMYYKKHSGVYNDPICNEGKKDLDDTSHYVLIVGYGVDKEGGPYWLIKNSWGKTWGDDGYLKLARNEGNMCHIATEAFYPLV